MNPTVKKWIVKPLIIAAISVGALAAVGFIVLTTQQQRLVNLAVGQLNQQFKGELLIEGSSIDLLWRFF